MSLINGLISYWKLDGNSNDSVGGNNGIDTSISYVPAKITTGKTLYLGFEGNEDSGTWDCIAQKEI